MSMRKLNTMNTMKAISGISLYENAVWRRCGISVYVASVASQYCPSSASQQPGHLQYICHERLERMPERMWLAKLSNSLMCSLSSSSSLYHGWKNHAVLLSYLQLNSCQR